MRQITFITGNQNKVDHLARLLDMPIKHQQLELDEIQSVDPRVVTEHKVRQAFEALNKPVLVDDVAMGLDELGGLPGPFIKYFVEMKNGLEQICRMVDGLANRRAAATATIGYYDGIELRIFKGEIVGEIADHPRTSNTMSYGWDSIFCPDGYGGKTRAELTKPEYDVVYLQIRPITELRLFLKSL